MWEEFIESIDDDGGGGKMV